MSASSRYNERLTYWRSLPLIELAEHILLDPDAADREVVLAAAVRDAHPRYRGPATPGRRWSDVEPLS